MTQSTMSNEANPRPVLFIHIPRTAGHNVWYRLSGIYGTERSQRLRNVSSMRGFDQAIPCTTFFHMLVYKLREAGFFDQQWLNGRFTFAYVRNPWERCVSVWAKQRGDQAKKPRAHKNTMPKEFADYIRALVDTDCRLNEHEMKPCYAQHYHTQTDYLKTPDGEWIPPFVGRFENLWEDFACICDSLHVPYPGPHRLRHWTQHGPYQEYYTPELRQIVARHEAEMIERFKYTF